LPLVLSPADQGTRVLLEQLSDQHHFKLNVAVEMSAASLKVDMLINHDKCTVVPRGRFLTEITRKQVLAMRVEPRITRTMNVFISNRVELNVRRAFLDGIVKCIAKRGMNRLLGWKTLVPASS
jgi:hypothetical protein